MSSNLIKRLIFIFDKDNVLCEEILFVILIIVVRIMTDLI